MRFSEDRLASLRCSDGVERCIHVWEPSQPKAVMLAIHGGLAHGGDYVTPALYFRKRDWATVSFDMHGHDNKKRIFVPRFGCFLDDIELFLAWVKNEYPGLPIIIMGHSMGGLIATHFGLNRLDPKDEQVRGFAISSPYYANAVKTSKILIWLSSLLSILVPRMKVPMEDFTDVLTHDHEITARHRLDEADHIRGSEATMRFAAELLKAQKQLQVQIQNWNFPTFLVIAGDDYLADAAVTREYAARLPQDKLTQLYYPDNYHENFNETNREEIFEALAAWGSQLLAANSSTTAPEKIQEIDS